jgi:hypothetical protein
MRKTEISRLWVVYRMTIHGKPSEISAVCEQGEWEAMERDRPGYHTLVLAGITNEGEAERLARTVSSESSTSKASERKRAYTKRIISPPAETPALVAGDDASLAPAGATLAEQSLLP